MLLTSITMTIARTLNTGDFNSVRVELSHTITMEKDELEQIGNSNIAHAIIRGQILEEMQKSLEASAEKFPNRANGRR